MGWQETSPPSTKQQTMAVSVDRVYQTVLTLLNKEQRGYLPQKEFNLLANQAQIEIFENYFFELGKASAQYGEMTEDYASIADNIFEKLEDFETVTESLTPDSNGEINLPTDLYRLQTILSNNIDVVKKKHREIGYMLRSPLTSPNAAMPNYTRTGNTVTIYPYAGLGSETVTLENIRIHYIRETNTTPAWEGVVTNGQIVVAPTTVNFELHQSEEPELVAKILTYAGLTVKATDVQQFGASKDQQIMTSEQ